MGSKTENSTQEDKGKMRKMQGDGSRNISSTNSWTITTQQSNSELPIWSRRGRPFQLNGDDEKAYVINFSCGTSRAVYFTTTRNLLTSEFINKLNEFIAVRTRPKKIISENAQTFKAAADFIEKLS